MRTTIYHFILLITGAALLGSCSTSSELTDNSFIKKRKYTKGFHVDFGKKHDAKPSAYLATMDTKPVRLDTVAASEDPAFDPAVLTASNGEAKGATAPAVAAAPAPVPAAKAKVPSTVLNTKAPQNAKQARTSMRDMRKSIRSNSGTYEVPAAQSASGGSKLLYIILAILLPPLAVGLLYGIGSEFWISLILTLIFFVPGMIYAIIKVLAH